MPSAAGKMIRASVPAAPRAGPPGNDRPGYERICALIHDRLGILLTPNKHLMVANRLGRCLHELGLPDYGALARYVEDDLSGDALDMVAGLIVTNHTYFLREPAHFAFLREVVLPEAERTLSRRGDNDLRLWCAAASTGEEAYSIAMTTMEHFGPRYASLDAGVLATDVSLRALRQGADGRYDATAADRLPPELRGRYFVPEADGGVRAGPALRREVLFRKFNLVADAFDFKRPFHAVFCRNVMIYFDKPTRDRLVAALRRVLTPDGYLFIGHCETIAGGQHGFRRVAPAVYRRTEKARD